MKKKFLGIILTVTLLFSIVPAFGITISAAEYSGAVTMTELKNGTYAAGGVYSISSVQEFGDFGELSNEANDYFAGSTVILAQNLTFNADWNAMGGTAPSVRSTSIATFKGVFDGQGKTISGIYFYLNQMGIFKNISGNGSGVKNLNIVNSGVKTAEAAVGMIAGTIGPGTDMFFENISVNANVSGGKSVALIAGQNAGNGSVRFTDITTDGVVNGLTNIAGIIADGVTGSLQAAFTRCSNNAVVKTTEASGDTVCIAGIAATVRAFTFIDCRNNGDIDANLPDITRNIFAGGMAGRAWNAPVTFKGCENNGGISVYGYLSGGMLGSFDGSDTAENKALRPTILVENCANNGDIVDLRDGNGRKVGGVIALDTATAALVVKNFVNRGKLQSTAFTGGVIADNRGTLTIENSANLGEIIALGGSGSNRSCAGGLLAQSYLGTSLFISNSVNLGKVTANECSDAAWGRAAGIAALADREISISNCLNAGEITGVPHAGGILGTYGVATGTVENCVNTGKINGSALSSGAIAGTFAGTNTASNFVKIKNTYYTSDSAANGVGINTTSAARNMKFVYDTEEIDETFIGSAETAGLVTPGEVLAKYNEFFSETAKKASEMLLGTKCADTLKAFGIGTNWLVTENFPVPRAAHPLAFPPIPQTADPVYEGLQFRINENSKLDIRFISSVKTLAFKDTGFEVYVIEDEDAAKSTVKTSGVVYSTLTGYEDGTKITYGANDFSGEYLSAISVENLPANLRISVVIKAFATNEDGERVYAASYAAIFDNAEFVMQYRY